MPIDRDILSVRMLNQVDAREKNIEFHLIFNKSYLHKGIWLSTMCRFIMHNHLLHYLALEDLNTADGMIKGIRIVVFGLEDVQTRHHASITLVRVVESEIEIENLLSNIGISEIKLES